MLPKIEYPITELILPSSGEKFYFRPFTVKEEKILLIANESEDLADKLRAVRQIVNNCCQGNLDVMKLASFDIEYLFLKIRAFSVDNIVELNYTDPDDGSQQKFYIDLNEIEVQRHPEHKNTIDAGEYKIKLNYPTIEALAKYNLNDSDDSIVDLIVSCIDIMWDDERAWKSTEYSEDEWKNLVESFSSKTLKEVGEFLRTAPALRHTIKFKNLSGVEKEMVLEGISDFLL